MGTWAGAARVGEARRRWLARARLEVLSDGDVQRQSAAAYRLYTATLTLNAAIAGLLLLGCLLLSFTLTFGSAAYSYGICLSLMAYAGWRFRQGGVVDRVTYVLGCQAQLLLLTALLAPLTYIAGAFVFPFADAYLLRLDRALGLEWRVYLDLVNAYPWLGEVSNFGYKMIRWPLFTIPLVLGLTGHVLHLNRFVLAFGVALLLTSVVSGLVPAVAAYTHLQLTPADYANINPMETSGHLAHLYGVRDGTLRELDVLGLTGIVTFPSFHAASCLLYLWAFWPVRVMRPIALAANGLMLLSTPIDGGHYFVDVLAGLAVAACGIWAALALSPERAERTAAVAPFRAA
jgi:hypothetical protein